MTRHYQKRPSARSQRLSLVLASALALSVALPAVADRVDTAMPYSDAAFGVAVREYLLENPEIIAEAILLLRAEQEAETLRHDVEAVREQLPALLDDFKDVDAVATDRAILVFTDLRCPHCATTHHALIEHFEADPSIRILTRHFPILGPESTELAKTALALRELYPDLEDKFTISMLDGLRGGRAAQIDAALTTIGLDQDAIARVEAQAASQSVASIISETHQVARALTINGTPAIIAGKQLFRGGVDPGRLQAALDGGRRP